MHDDASPPAAPFDWYQPPRLGIIHLLAWVTVAALLMKFDLAISFFDTGGGPRQTESYKLATNLIGAVNAILFSAIFTGGAVFFWDRIRRRERSRIQPGHWIVTISLILGLIELMSRPLQVWFRTGGQFSLVALFSLYLIAVFPTSIAYFVAAYRMPEPRRWKWALGFLGLEHLGYSFYYIVTSLIFSHVFDSLRLSSNLSVMNLMGQVLEYFAFLIAAYVLLIAAFDFLKRLRRDWLHWLGVATPIILAMISIAWKFVVEFLVKSAGP
jgi:hypothetical protein